MKVVEMKTDNDGMTAPTGEFMFSLGSPEIKLSLLPDTRYACPLIPIPDGYRLVTDEEKQKYGLDELWEHIKLSSNVGGIFCSYDFTPSSQWFKDVIYVIREDWEPEPKVEVTVTVNGKPVDPSTISKETWVALRGEE